MPTNHGQSGSGVWTIQPYPGVMYNVPVVHGVNSRLSDAVHNSGVGAPPTYVTRITEEVVDNLDAKMQIFHEASLANAEETSPNYNRALGRFLFFNLAGEGLQPQGEKADGEPSPSEGPPSVQMDLGT